ncbi:unnamed protein product [Camellia sinensis]
MESTSPISIQQTLHQDPNTESSPKPLPYKKSFVTSLMEAATLQTPSFREDSYFVSYLKSFERKALQELKDKLMASHGLDSMWAISLLSNDDKSNVILLKFLRARDFRVTDSLQMLLKCLQWRKDFEADTILDEDLGFKELEGVVVICTILIEKGTLFVTMLIGVFKVKDMYERIFGDDEKLQKFIRWRVQVLERGIKLLHFKPGGINSIIQVTDLKDMPKGELRVAQTCLEEAQKQKKRRKKKEKKKRVQNDIVLDRRRSHSRKPWQTIRTRITVLQNKKAKIKKTPPS